jgi:hypothetical protein
VRCAMYFFAGFRSEPLRIPGFQGRGMLLTSCSRLACYCESGMLPNPCCGGMSLNSYCWGILLSTLLLQLGPVEAQPSQPPTTPDKRGDGAVKTAVGDLRLTIEWGDGVPVLHGRIGAQAFASVEEESLVAAWSPKGEGREGGGESGEHLSAEDGGSELEEGGSEEADDDPSGGGNGEEMDLDSLDDAVLSEIERSRDHEEVSRRTGAVAAGVAGLSAASKPCPDARKGNAGKEAGTAGTAGKRKRVGAGASGGEHAGNLAGGRHVESEGRPADVLVRGLAPRTRRDDLHRLFAKCGSIRYIRLLLKKDAAGKLSGKQGSGRVDFAVVEFHHEASVAGALAKNGSLVAGAKIVVSAAKSAMPVSKVAGAGDGRKSKGLTSKVRITQVPYGADTEAVYSWLGEDRYVTDVTGPVPMTLKKAHQGPRQLGTPAYVE